MFHNYLFWVVLGYKFSSLTCNFQFSFYGFISLDPRLLVPYSYGALFFFLPAAHGSDEYIKMIVYLTLHCPQWEGCKRES